MKSFAILYHKTEKSHYDILIEDSDVCLTWRIEEDDLASFYNGAVIKASRLPDHRKMYLNYQGPVSGNRGEVIQYDSGKYALNDETSDTLSLVLQGKKLSGTLFIKSWKESVSSISLERLI